MAPAVMIGMMAVGGALSIAGNIHQANQQAKADEYNAQMDEQQAQLTVDQGEEDAARELFATKRTLGSIRAAYGASGVRMDGSPKEYLEQQAVIGEKNIMSIKNQAYIKAQSLRNEAAMLRGRKDDVILGGILGGAAAGVNAGASIMKRM